MARTRTGRLSSSRITGINEVIAKLQKLQKEVRTKVERRAVRKAVQPIFQAAVAKVPVGETGALAMSLKVATEKQENGRIAGIVKATAPHAHLVELGFVHWRSKDRVPGRPFLRPAFDENLNEAESIFISEVNSAVEAALK